LYVTATALAKLADPQGEVAITKACAEQVKLTIHAISSNLDWQLCC
jgi:hypothetical protein